METWKLVRYFPKDECSKSVTSRKTTLDYLMPMIQLGLSILENLYLPLLAFQFPILNKNFSHASVVDVNEQL